MNKWDYGGAFERHPIQTGTAVFDNGSRLKAGSLFDPLPDFMLRADCLFVDPPWTQGNMTSFYTKAGLPRPQEDYAAFYSRLFECVEEIMPKVCYLEIGKDYLADFIFKMRALYRNVTFYNSSYYHNTKNHCYVVRGSDHTGKPKLDGMDEERHHPVGLRKRKVRLHWRSLHGARPRSPVCVCGRKAVLWDRTQP